VSLFIDGAAVGEGRVAATLPMVYSADETSDVGLKRGSPMADMMSRGNNFTGTVDGVVIETTGESIDHLISHEDVLNIIMARQYARANDCSRVVSGPPGNDGNGRVAAVSMMHYSAAITGSCSDRRSMTSGFSGSSRQWPSRDKKITPASRQASGF
jgi:hypothetical protein